MFDGGVAQPVRAANATNGSSFFMRSPRMFMQLVARSSFVANLTCSCGSFDGSSIGSTLFNAPAFLSPGVGDMGVRGKPGWALVALAMGWWLFGNKEPDPVPSPSSIEKTIRPSPAPVTIPPPANLLLIPETEIRLDDETTPVSLSTKTAARVRKNPTTKSAIVATLQKGQQVKVYDREGDWLRISAMDVSGWIRKDLLERAARPQYLRPASPVPQRVARPTNDANPTPVRKRSGDRPIRDAYVGTCDCPYDVMRNGRLCGGRSAYNRPGGREPVCYE